MSRTLAEAQAIAHLGSFEYLAATGTTIWSEEEYRIYGLDPAGPSPAYATLLERHLPPEDAKLLHETFSRAVQARGVYELEHAIVRPDGEVRFVHDRAHPYLGPDGELVRYVGITLDVTDRRRAEAALRASEASLKRAQEIAHLGSWELDLAANRLTWSDEAYRIFGLEPQEFGATYEAFLKGVHPEDRAAVDAAYSESLRDGRDTYEIEHRVVRADTGEVRHVHEKCQHVRDEHGRIVRSIGMVHDVTERKRAEDALREADRRKDEFLGMLSHELRNPLAPIRNSTYVLRHALPGSEQSRRAQEVIERQTQHLARLVDDLLDVTRIGRGKIELRRARVDLGGVVSASAEDFRALMHDRGVRFEALAREELWCDADATRIAQVVGNLLHNASKFTRRGDEVTLSAERDGPDALIRVRDTGAGIGPDLLKRVFEPFVQGERTLARTEGGLGLGLALVKAITELHGGSAQAWSAGEGMGSEFVVRLPLLVGPGAETADHERPERGGGGRRVLVVDDNRDSAVSLAEIVEMLGHRANVAFDGPSAIEHVRAHAPDVVLCDIGLPGMNGYEVARILRAEGRPLQLLAVSGYTQPEDLKKAVEAGFDAHVAKPPDIAELERLLA